MDDLELRRDPALRARLAELRQIDVRINLAYIARAYLVIVASIAAVVGFHELHASHGWSWWWGVPLAFAAVVLIGASQHQLAGGVHEATHRMLCRRPLLNELISDWLCAFPLFGSTQIFRQHHLAHHRWVNDEQRDPDFAQLRASGHWLDFPMPGATFLALLRRQLLLWPLVRYTLARARFDALGAATAAPADDAGRRGLATAIGSGHLLVVGLWLIALPDTAPPVLALVGPLALFLLVAVVLLCLPAHAFHAVRFPPVIPPRWGAVNRTLYLTLFMAALGWLSLTTGWPVLTYLLLLWVLPLFTSFAFFMILRQLVQHGNADRGWMSNTRTFLVGPLLRYAVFPFGMDYHLPHHMFASVPHYRLPDLHRALLRFPAYAEGGHVVEGYLRPRRADRHRPPTVLESLAERR